MGAGVIFLVIFSMFVVYDLGGYDGTYTIRINEEPWYVTGNKAVREFTYTTTYFTGSGQRSILYPGLSYDRFLEINLTVVSGSLDLSVESSGEVLFEVSDASEVIITLAIENTQLRIFESPHESNVTLQGYILAYCWL